EAEADRALPGGIPPVRSLPPALLERSTKELLTDHLDIRWCINQNTRIADCPSAEDRRFLVKLLHQLNRGFRWKTMDLVRSWDGYSTQERSIDPFHHGLDETELFGRSSDREDVGGLFNGDRNSLRLRWPWSAPVAEELPKLGRDGGRWPGGALVF